jgi:hypothetical protein
VIPPSRPTHPLSALPIAAIAGLLALGAALAGLAVAASQASGQAADNAAATQIVRTSVSLPMSGGGLGRWTPVVAHDGAKVSFRVASDGGGGRMLRLSDRAHHGGYVTVSTALSPQSAVTSRADVNIARLRLGSGRARALMAIGSASGESVQAGVIRTREGQLRWAVWHKTDAEPRADVVVSHARMTTRRWYRIQLVTKWARAGARCRLLVDGKLVAVGAPRDMTGVLAQRVTVGLGRPSSRRETGTILVRRASVRAAVGVPGSGGGGGAADPPGGSPSPGPGPGPTPSIPGQVLLRGDWNTGNTSQFSSVQRVAADRIRAVTSPVREGSHAGRFEVHPGDDPFCQSGSGCYGDRAEVSLETNEQEGDERWYSWSTMVDPSFPRTGAFQVISQWHSRANGRPPVAFFAENDSLVLMVHPHRAPGDQIAFVRAWSGPLRRGAWQDIVVHAKWSGSDSVGFLELWVNGARQTFDNGQQRRYIRTMYPGVENYFKQGLYRDASVSGTGIVYHDGFKQSAG